MIRPRFIACILAFFGGYFWMPCPLCGRKFAGFEDGGMLMTDWSGGRSVCPRCTDEANGRNREYIKNHPHVVRVIPLVKDD